MRVKGMFWGERRSAGKCFCDGVLPFSPSEVVWSLQDPGAAVREGGGQAAWKGGDGQGGY